MEDLIVFFGVDKNALCQICFVLGHSIYKCRNIFNHESVLR